MRLITKAAEKHAGKLKWPTDSKKIGLICQMFQKMLYLQITIKSTPFNRPIIHQRDLQSLRFTEYP